MKNKLRLLSYSQLLSIAIPLEVLRDGPIDDRETLIQKIYEVCKSYNLRYSDLACRFNLPHEQILIKKQNEKK